MSDAQRGQLVTIWLLAADHNGVIPADPELIQKLCYMESPPDLNFFMERGFLEPDVSVTPGRRQPDASVTPLRPQHDQPEKKTDSEAEAEDPSPGGEDGDKSPAPCPHQEIIQIYHDILPELRQVKEWTDERQSLLRTRWREKPERQSLEWWREYFQRVARSDFLMGRVEGDRRFQADLEWLIRPKNMPKVLEGKYDNSDSGTDGGPFDGYEAAN